LGTVFGIVNGNALLLSGLGFGILAVGGALRNPDSVLRRVRERRAGGHGASAAPTGA
jgi:hypothetical protein